MLSQGIAASRIHKNSNISGIFDTVKNVEYTAISGISVLDIMLTPGIDEHRLSAIIKTSGEYGCANLQPNVLSADELKAAQQHPENYKNLIIRVAGLSVRFVNFEKGIQDEIIGRTVQN